MRVVALEEHLMRFDLASRVPSANTAARGWPLPGTMPPEYAEYARRLAEDPTERLRAMDADGVTKQILSAVGPGADIVAAAEAGKLASDYNDYIAGLVADHPKRFGGFSHLPIGVPEAAADELERCVTELGFSGGMISGLTNGLFLDDPSFDPVLARAAKFDCPLYIHPAPPPASVRDAYYGGLPGAFGQLLALGGWGWHFETGIHVVRLVLAGCFDRHPNLKIIIGHMGEGLPVMLGRLDDIFSPSASSYLNRGVSETILEQVWITTSGFYTLPPFLAALTTFGADRIMFAADYPYSSARKQVDFLHALPLSLQDKKKIAHGNADRLLKLKD